MQTPLSLAAYCEPHRPTHSCKPAKSATFLSIVLELLLSDFRLLERLLSPWLSFLLISHELHSEQPNWQRISMKNGFPLPHCHSSARLMHQFCLLRVLPPYFPRLVVVWAILAFFNSDLTGNPINQMSEQTQKREQKSSANCPNNIFVNLRSEIVFKTRATKLCRGWNKIQANISSKINIYI